MTIDKRLNSKIDMGFKAEKEKSLVENKVLNMENLVNAEAEKRIEGRFGAVLDLGVVKVFDKSGKFVFSGNHGQMIIFWKNKDYGSVEDIGGISDEDCKSIFRFGAGDDHGFIDGKRIEGLFKNLEDQILRKKLTAQDTQKNY